MGFRVLEFWSPGVDERLIGAAVHAHKAAQARLAAAPLALHGDDWRVGGGKRGRARRRAKGQGPGGGRGVSTGHEMTDFACGNIGPGRKGRGNFEFRVILPGRAHVMYGAQRARCARAIFGVGRGRHRVLRVVGQPYSPMRCVLRFWGFAASPGTSTTANTAQTKSVLFHASRAHLNRFTRVGNYEDHRTTECCWGFSL